MERLLRGCGSTTWHVAMGEYLEFNLLEALEKGASTVLTTERVAWIDPQGTFEQATSERWRMIGPGWAVNLQRQGANAIVRRSEDVCWWLDACGVSYTDKGQWFEDEV